MTEFSFWVNYSFNTSKTQIPTHVVIVVAYMCCLTAPSSGTARNFLSWHQRHLGSSSIWNIRDSFSGLQAHLSKVGHLKNTPSLRFLYPTLTLYY